MQEVIKKILQPNDTKIVLCVLDGLGGLPENGKTELEAASTPNLDELARRALSYHPVQVNPRPIKTVEDVKEILELAW